MKTVRNESWTSVRTEWVVMVYVCAVLLVWSSPSGLAQPSQPRKLSEASLEQLMDVEVTSVSKKEQRISKVAAAIYVISPEEIRRSGATNIADLLRMVPGMDVSQIRAKDWALSARGFNGVFANKLLVLLDGRTVYSPVYSGVLWFMQDVPLADIERIEVIRGPGATVWGANAVNGVINIITKSAKATPGVLVEAGVGSQLAAQGLAQYGAAIGKTGDYRVFGSYSGYHSLLGSNGREAADAWHIRHGGFRSEWDLTGGDSLTVQGDLFATQGGETYNGFQSLSPPFQSTYNEPVTSRGGNLLGRWKHVFSPKSDTALQVYFDRFDVLAYGVEGIIDTVDLDFQHHLALGSWQDLVWGLGFRSIQDDYRPSPSYSFSPPRDSETLASAFVHDEIKLADPLWLTLGTKFEHNGQTGASLQPSVRLLWSADDRHTLWGAISRALRQPSRTDLAFRENYFAFSGQSGIPSVVRIFGNPDYQAEQLRAYELGYRWAPVQRASLDISTFYNSYYNLKSVEPGAPYLETDPLPIHVIIPQYFKNKTNGNSYGAEASANLKVTSSWKLSAGYSWFRMNLHPDASSMNVNNQVNGDAPAHQSQIRSYYTWPRTLDLDVALYYVGRLVDQSIPGYFRLDARLARRFGEWTELSVVGQNLLDDHHFEYSQTLETALACAGPALCLWESGLAVLAFEMKDSELSTGCPERRTQRRRSNALWRKPAFGWMLPWFLAIPSWAIAFPPLKAETHAVAADEYQVKAQFLYNFAKFVDWPTSSFTSPQEPFTFCVVGEDPFGHELDQAVRGKTINGRKLVVRRVFKAQNIRACQIAFINSPDEKSVKRTLDELNAASVLTVGGNNGFTEWGGIVKFTLEGNKIRFEINTDAAEHARLKISSKLLSLAKVVKRGRKGEHALFQRPFHRAETPGHYHAGGERGAPASRRNVSRLGPHGVSRHYAK